VGRQFIFVILAIALSIVAVPGVSAQGSRKGGARPHNNDGGGNNHPGREFRHGAERAYHQLSPEERQMFRRNAERWLQLDPQQRQELRQRDIIMRQRMKAEAEAMLQDSGLRLENGARAQFEERYFQERRRIEHSLRQEIEAKRQQELPQLKERLKSEFQPHEAAPSASGKPGKN
jgi:hypothetical protein